MGGAITRHKYELTGDIVSDRRKDGQVKIRGQRADLGKVGVYLALPAQQNRHMQPILLASPR